MHAAERRQPLPLPQQQPRRQNEKRRGRRKKAGAENEEGELSDTHEHTWSLEECENFFFGLFVCSFVLDADIIKFFVHRN